MTPTDTVPAEKYAEEEARAFANHGCVRASTERYVCNGYILFIFFKKIINKLTKKNLDIRLQWLHASARVVAMRGMEARDTYA